MNLILKIRNKGLVNEFCSLGVRKEVAEHYRRRVGDNSDGSSVKAINKLRRNFIIGKLESEGDGYINKSYGNLYIRAYNNEIIYIENRKGRFEFEYDKKKKKILDKIFGL